MSQIEAERAAFEKWAADQWGDRNVPDNAWLGWQARAALSQQSPAPSPDLAIYKYLGQWLDGTKLYAVAKTRGDLAEAIDKGNEPGPSGGSPSDGLAAMATRLQGTGKWRAYPLDAAPTPPRDYWPSAKVTVHEDEVRFGVHRVTAELFAPGLPPGVYEMWLGTSPAPSVEPPPKALDHSAVPDDEGNESGPTVLSCLQDAIDGFEEHVQFERGSLMHITVQKWKRVARAASIPQATARQDSNP